MSKPPATRLSRLMSATGRLTRTLSTFSAVKQDQGTAVAILALMKQLKRSVIVRAAEAARAVRRPEDLFALLPIPTLFVRQDVLFIGYLEAALGLGESLRGLVRSVSTTGFPFALYPFNLGVEKRLIGGFMQDHYDLRHRHRINVIELSADQLPNLLREIGRWKTIHAYNILRTYWELRRAPAEWASSLKYINEIWVPNDFVGNAFREIFDGPITIIPPCVEVEADITFDRSELNLELDIFYFIFSFDYHSHPGRKNPLGVIRAFQSAFPDLNEKVGLLIKSTNTTCGYEDVTSSILDASKQDQRIKVIDSVLPRNKMLSLLRQSDCYVSLHRSEGFGLGMAEAMALGKPVIGTDYSGNTGFLSEYTGFPIPFTLRQLQPSEYIFSDGQTWAEPDESAAVAAMQSVFYNQREAQRRAAFGKVFVETNHSRANVGRISAQRLREILGWLPPLEN